jgi:hypothetical protein
VYDSSQHYPLEAVSVISTSGRGTVTNSEGNYEIDVAATDSIFFSYLGKPTMKFPILTIQNILQFNISLHVSIPTLKEVKIRPRNYRQDSIQNREDYAVLTSICMLWEEDKFIDFDSVNRWFAAHPA